MFNMSSGKAVEMSLDQLMKTPADDIPRYLKIKDAVVPAGSYVEFRKSKSNSLQNIYYPVYPGTVAVGDDSQLAKLVINDSHVTDSDLDSTGTYFSNPKFTIEGKFDNDKLGEDVLKLFTESGLKVSPDAVVLNRGDTGMSTGNAIIISIIGLLVMVISAATFIPEGTLMGMS
jgi:hypothetical protein